MAERSAENIGSGSQDTTVEVQGVSVQARIPDEELAAALGECNSERKLLVSAVVTESDLPKWLALPEEPEARFSSWMSY